MSINAKNPFLGSFCSGKTRKHKYFYNYSSRIEVLSVKSMVWYTQIKYIQLQQVCDDLFGYQLFLAHALSVPQNSLSDGTVLEPT